MTTFHANESAQLQLDDAHRATLTALCCLRLVVGDATDATLLSEAQRLHAAFARLRMSLQSCGSARG